MNGIGFNVSANQIASLVQLTEPSLHHLDCTLIVVKNKSELMLTDFYQSLNDAGRQRLNEFMVDFTSLFVGSHNAIVMLLDGIDGQNHRDKTIQFANTLFHELRHAWQHANGIFDMENPVLSKNEQYQNQPHEIDAVIYSEWATNHYRNEIASAFGIDSDWSIRNSIG